MFYDLNFGKLLLLAVIALVVIGPKRLPKAARMAGAMVRRARQQWESVRAEVERDLELDELRRAAKQATEQAESVRTATSGGIQSVRTSVNKALEGVRKAAEDLDRAPAVADETAVQPAALDGPVAGDESAAAEEAVALGAPTTFDESALLDESLVDESALVDESDLLDEPVAVDESPAREAAAKEKRPVTVDESVAKRTVAKEKRPVGVGAAVAEERDGHV